jgi:DNA polymerase III alpha subunit
LSIEVLTKVELTALTEFSSPAGALARYGSREQNPNAYRQLDHELDTIDKLGFPGYFLIVYDIVDFCRRESIYCQGRGSAANSAVCYALGITNVDAVRWGLLFERFLVVEVHPTAVPAAGWQRQPAQPCVEPCVEGA